MAGKIQHQDVVGQQESFRYSSYEEIAGHAASPGLILCWMASKIRRTWAPCCARDAAGIAACSSPTARAAVTAAAVKTSAGAAAHVRVGRETNISNLLERLKGMVIGLWA